MNRRDFMMNSAAATMTAAMAMGAEEIFASPEPQATAAAKPVKTAVIGLGPQGKDILTSLAKLGTGQVAYICDTYKVPAFVTRIQASAPNAVFTDDYKKVLADKTVQAVFIATPSHQHKQIVLDAIAAGKHVYCEAPLASSLDDAKAIAVAGAASKQVFQAGLQFRSNKQHRHVLEFARSGALGQTIVGGRAQSHKKQSWRRVASSGEREEQLNWRLSKATSGGVANEIAIHQLDIASWFLNAKPVSVTGFGGVLAWGRDGMQTPDTIQCIMEFPNNVRFSYDATIGNSFDGAYELFMGPDSAMMIRDQRAWMFKETDAPLLGWEVYARKDKLGVGDDTTGTGIALIADATKLIKQGKQPGQVGQDVSKTSLYQSIDAFLNCILTGAKPYAGAQEGYAANVIALKVNEAITTGTRVVFQNEWFKLS